MKILVTGAEGFIGSHLVEKLVKNNYKVKALVSYNFLNNWGWLEDINPNILNKIDIISGDIRDCSFVQNLTKDCTHIINLSALIAIPFSYEAPRSYIETNTIGTLNLLEAVNKNKNKLLIHTSTSEVYGSALYTPIDEMHPLQAQSPYSASKIAADQICNSFYNSYNTPVTIIRPFNTFGPRQSSRAVIPSVINQILNKNKKIKVGSVEPKRDFSFVDDTVDGFICALKTKNKILGETINLGSGFDFSILETINIISSILDYNKGIQVENIRKRPNKSEVNRLLSDNTKAKKILNWSPKYSGLKGFEKGIKKTIKWFQDNKNTNLYKDIYNK